MPSRHTDDEEDEEGDEEQDEDELRFHRTSHRKKYTAGPNPRQPPHSLVSLGLELGYTAKLVHAAFSHLVTQHGQGDATKITHLHQDTFLDILNTRAQDVSMHASDASGDERDQGTGDGSENMSDVDQSSASDGEEASASEDGDGASSEDIDKEDDFLEIIGIKEPTASRSTQVYHVESMPGPRAPPRSGAPAVQGKIHSFFQKAPAAAGSTGATQRLLPQGQPSAPDVWNAVHRERQQQQQLQLPQQQQGSGWADPPTAEERRLSPMDLANIKVFGNRSFRPLQRDVIQAAMQGQDVFVLMPTGGGKSLCYQLPAVISPGITLVVCPLLSLMQDQVRGLCHQTACGGVPASCINSQQSRQELLAVFRELSKPRPSCKLLYVTPEQLVKSASLNNILARLHAAGMLSRLVIDEAHCVSTWGHDFRPDYKQLGKWKASYPGVPLMAMTATATDAVAADILKTLSIPRARVFKASFFRSNLHFSVVDKIYGTDEEGRHEPFASLVDYVQEQGEHASGIVYCLSRDESEHVSRTLEQEGISSAFYHAGMNAKRRMDVQNQWRSGEIQVVVATIAFGMGIDKPDVRFVVHFTLSKSVEGYFQEAGRAGRDGKPSNCVVFFAPRDKPRINNIICRNKSKQCKEVGKAALEHMVSYCKESRCRHQVLLEYFSDRAALPTGSCTSCCDNCVQPPPGAGAGGLGAGRAGGGGALGGFVKASSMSLVSGGRGRGRGAGGAGRGRGRGRAGGPGKGAGKQQQAGPVQPVMKAKPAVAAARAKQMQAAAVVQQQQLAQRARVQKEAVHRPSGTGSDFGFDD